MGHRKTHAPKHGSLAYLPRKRAKKPVARIRYWPKIQSDTPRLLGFSAYKAGMTYVFAIEDRKRSPNFGKEVMRATTILETPPILICGIRTYAKTPYGLENISEAWLKDPPAILDRLMVLPEAFDTDAMLEKLQQNIAETAAVKSSQPPSQPRPASPRRSLKPAKSKSAEAPHNNNSTMPSNFSAKQSHLKKSSKTDNT